MKQRLTAILLVLFSKQYIVITEEKLNLYCKSDLMNIGRQRLLDIYIEKKELELQEFYDVLNFGK